MGEFCIRKKVIIDNQNIYVVVGKNFVHATVPFENRVENLQLRTTVDALCEAISEALEEHFENNNSIQKELEDVSR